MATLLTSYEEWLLVPLDAVLLVTDKKGEWLGFVQKTICQVEARPYSVYEESALILVTPNFSRLLLGYWIGDFSNNENRRLQFLLLSDEEVVHYHLVYRHLVQKFIGLVQPSGYESVIPVEKVKITKVDPELPSKLISISSFWNDLGRGFRELQTIDEGVMRAVRVTIEPIRK